MDRHYVFRFFLGGLAGWHFREVNTETPLAETAQTPSSTYQERELTYPAHTCVAKPILPCPACLKWTGDGFATVKANPQCFRGISLQPLPENDVTSVIASCAKTKINKPNQGNSLIDRRTQNMRQLPSLIAAPPLEPPEPPKTPESITASRNSVLVVERDDSLTKFFAKSLPEQGYARFGPPVTPKKGFACTAIVRLSAWLSSTISCHENVGFPSTV
jgi:hypothetical protein